MQGPVSCPANLETTVCSLRSRKHSPQQMWQDQGRINEQHQMKSVVQKHVMNHDADKKHQNGLDWNTHLFLRILFSFFWPCPPHPSPGNFLPQNPLFLGPQIYSFWYRKGNVQGLGFGDGSGLGCLTGKKRQILFFWRAKKGENIEGQSGQLLLVAAPLSA